MIVGVILARAGSKRIPHKNKLIFAGRPLVAWTIVEAMRSAWLANLVVSSNDQEILQIADQYNVPADQRPAHLAKDETTSYEALLHVIDGWGADDVVVLLQPTSPLRLASDIDATIAPAQESLGCPSVSVTAGAGDTPNGAVYVGSVSWLRSGGNWDTDPQMHRVPMPADRSIDIDTQDDWDKAEKIMDARS
jgi:CMP-N,N'-diacetyllegionaminic acid synthase